MLVESCADEANGVEVGAIVGGGVEVAFGAALVVGVGIGVDVGGGVEVAFGVGLVVGVGIGVDVGVGGEVAVGAGVAVFVGVGVLVGVWAETVSTVRWTRTATVASAPISGVAVTIGGAVAMAGWTAALVLG